MMENGKQNFKNSRNFIRSDKTALLPSTIKNFLKMCGVNFNSEYLYIKEKH
jgi:hypothetical protein